MDHSRLSLTVPVTFLKLRLNEVQLTFKKTQKIMVFYW